MELKDFISDTIYQIVSGLADAQSRIADLNNASINPDSMKWTDAENMSQGRRIKDIEFDVAVSVETSGSAGAKLSVPVIGALVGGKLEASTNSSNNCISRVKFSVPVRWPS
jgi:hypothetical protein